MFTILLLRQGWKASRILLPSTWEAPNNSEEILVTRLPATRDISLGKQRKKRAMQRYLRQQQCLRTSLSEHLDGTKLRKWCIFEDVPCDICKESHSEPIEAAQQATRYRPSERHFTGQAVIQRARLTEYSELAKYRKDPVAVRGSYMLCRAIEGPWDHAFFSCSSRHNVFR